MMRCRRSLRRTRPARARSLSWRWARRRVRTGCDRSGPASACASMPSPGARAEADVPGDGQAETVTDVITFNKNNQRIEHLGLSLAESKQLLSTLQRHLLQQQVATFLDARSTCPDCGTPLTLKAHGSRSLRTLFGTFKVYSPRLEHCDCKRRKTSSFRPLAALLTEPVAPELLYMEAKWSSLVSYGLSLDALQDFLPLDLTLDVKTVRYDTLKVAKRLEAELGEDQAGFIEGAPSDWDLLPSPEGFFTVGIDGGYLHNWVDKKHHFEVIVGKSMR